MKLKVLTFKDRFGILSMKSLGCVAEQIMQCYMGNIR
jgi:hypothetical protein